MSLASTIRARAESVGAGPRKRWGQNFLVDEVALDAIAEAAVRRVPGTAVLEIGPGPGTLTERLAARASAVVAIERDPRWAAFLQDHFRDAPVRIIEEDATRTAWRELTANTSPWVVAGNIPYNLSGPLLIRAWEDRELFARATFMVQAEVADRLVARPGSKAYGTLSVLFQRAGAVERVRRVPAGSFWPAPKVDSAVITARFDRALSADAGRALQRVVRAAFGQRRKTLRNALGARFDATWLAAAAAVVDLGRRAETLSVEEFDALSRLEVSGDERGAEAPDPA